MDQIRQLELQFLGRTPKKELDIARWEAADAKSHRDSTQRQLDELDDDAVYEVSHYDNYSVIGWEIVKRTPKQLHIVCNGYTDRKRTLPRHPIEAGEHVEVGARRWPRTFMSGAAAGSILERQLLEQERWADRSQRRLEEVQDQLRHGEVPLDAERREVVRGLAEALGIAKKPSRPLEEIDWRRVGF